jgi:hypothetical protein
MKIEIAYLLHARLVSVLLSCLSLALYHRKRHAPACVPRLPPGRSGRHSFNAADLCEPRRRERVLPTSIPRRALVSLDDRESHPVAPR